MTINNLNVKNLISESSWHIYLKDLFLEEPLKRLSEFLIAERQKYTVFPDKSQVFNAFNVTSFDNIKVVILGQDPYHGVNQAHGLSFSVKEGIRIPPSLLNIYKELMDDIDGFKMPNHGDLTLWAKQGVFLLNTVLTVRENEPFSHKNQGWEFFTDRVISLISQNKDNVVFVLWGSSAKEKIKLIDTKKHYILTAAHPSPLSAYRGFFGCKHFSKINAYLALKGYDKINWQV